MVSPQASHGKPAETPVVVARPNAPRKIWGLSRLWWAILTFWIVVAFATGLETTVLATGTPREVIQVVLGRLGPWLFMTGLIIRLSTKYTLDAANWRRVIWVYLGAFVISMGMVALFSYFGPPPLLLGRRGADGLGVFANDPRSLTFLILTRMTLQAPTFLGLVAVAHAVRFYERDDARKLEEAELRAQLVQARLQALQLQLNPHFLFNTLNSIASLVQDNPATAESMIEALGELLRVTTSTRQQKVTVREELHFLDQYLLIQHMRFGERLMIEKQVDPAVLEDQVPVLILQPLVENAIKHGVQIRAEASRIKISVQPVGEGHFLRLEITNSGPVLNWAGVKIEERIGLSNTRARLQAMFGQEASLELYRRQQGGFVARILIPRSATAPLAAPQSELQPVYEYSSRARR